MGSRDRHDTGAVGIIMLDTTFPRIVGDVGHPDTFRFAVNHRIVKGATPRRVVLDADPELLQPFIQAGRHLIQHGARLITTSCGFLALFQSDLQQALTVPVLTSSLLQVPMARGMISSHQKIGILTAHSRALTPDHLAGVGIEDDTLVTAGMEDTQEFAAVFIGGKSTIDVEACRREMKQAAEAIMDQEPEIGAIVLECTNMPPFSSDVRRVTGVPVFDVVTMLDYAYATLFGPRFESQAIIHRTNQPGGVS